MFIGAYLCATSSIFFLILVGLIIFVKPKLSQITRYFWGTVFLSGVGLALFILLSSWAGLFSFGVASSYRIPQEYIENGAIGWAILLLGILGILSPALSALWILSKQGRLT
jgi:hypothetical protein